MVFKLERKEELRRWRSIMIRKKLVKKVTLLEKKKKKTKSNV